MVGGLATEAAEHADGVSDLAVATVNGQRVIISGGADGTLRLWDLARSHQVGPVMSGHPVTDVSAMPPEEWIPAVFAGTSMHQVFAMATAQTGAGPVAIVGGDDGARMWDLTTGEARGEPLTDQLVMRVVTADIEGRPTAVVSEGASRVRLWDLDSGTSIGELPGDVAVDGAVTALAAEEVGGRTVVFTLKICPPRAAGYRCGIRSPVSRSVSPWRIPSHASWPARWRSPCSTDGPVS